MKTTAHLQRPALLTILAVLVLAISAISLPAATPSVARMHVATARLLESAPTNTAGFGGLTQVCVDAQTNLFFTGYFSGGLNMGGQSLTNTNLAVLQFAGRLSATGQLVWLTNSTSTLTPAHALTNPAGGVTLVSYFQGPMTNSWNGTSLTSTSDWGAVVLHLDANGAVQGSTLLEANGISTAVRPGGEAGAPFSVESALFDGAGNFYLGGNYQRSLSIAGTVLSTANGTNDLDYFVAKLGTGGILQWAKTGGSPQNDELFDLDVDAAGNVFAVGIFGGTNGYGTNQLVAPNNGVNGDGDGFLLKLNPDGSLAWAKQASSVATNFSRDFTTVLPDGTGGCYFLGHQTRADVTAGVPAINFDAFLGRFGTDGMLQWVKDLTVGNGNLNAMLKRDASGNLVVAGEFDDTLSVAGQTNLTSTGNPDAFMAKFSSGGLFQWARQFTVDEVQEFVVDDQGNAFLSGTFTDSLDLGMTNLTARGGTDTFLIKVGPNGEVAWGLPIGGVESDWAGELLPDNTGGAWVSGMFIGLNYLGGVSLAGPGIVSSFIAHIADSPAAGPPALIAHPFDKTRLRGNNFALQVTALGEGLAYQWQRNGTNVPGGSNSVLWLNNATREVAGVYSVVVSNRFGGVVSSNASVRVIAPQQMLPPERLSGGQFRVRFNDQDGVLPVASDLPFIEVQVSTNLSSTNWTTLTNSLVLTNGTVQLDDLGNTNGARRFYRVIER